MRARQRRRADHLLRDHDRRGLPRLRAHAGRYRAARDRARRPARRDQRRSRRPAVTAITPISLDHQAFLGDTLAAIAGEKAGILKPGVPAVIGPQPAEAAAVIEARAARSARRSPAGSANGAATAAMRGPRRMRYDRASCWRPRSAAAVARRARTRSPMPASRSPASSSSRASRLPPDAIAGGLRQIEWPARLQRLTRGPLVEHAAAGLGALARRRPQPGRRRGPRPMRPPAGATARSTSSSAC